MHTLKINEKTMLPLDTIICIAPLSEDDRMRIAEKYDDIDVSRYQSRIEIKGGKIKLAMETIDALKKQLPFVNLGSDRFIPAANILSASPFSEEDAKALKKKNYTLGKTFRSAVDTPSGRILSQATPEQVMARRAKALDGAGDNAPANE